MTLEEITKRVSEIEAVKRDDETAHALEDDLREDFIEYIRSGGCEDLAEKAEKVLSTSKIDFARWCA